MKGAWFGKSRVGEEFGEESTYAHTVLLCFSWDPLPVTDGDGSWARGICSSTRSPAVLPRFSAASERLVLFEHTHIN